ncbi:MAG: hypothetical protein ABIJ56_19375 [Pseudomonadota bacterium]
MKKKSHILVAALLALTSISSQGEATTKKSYINKYVLIMDWTERALLWVEKHKEDPSLGKVALEIAETNIKLLQEFSPPKELIEIHPHFISIVENSANAFEAVASGSPSAFYKYKKKVQKGRKSLFSVMRELNFVFPAII